MREERPVIVRRGTACLEGLYQAADGRAAGAVVSHPHPLMGGDMRNPVVVTLTEALAATGLSTLRFNFRGVGMSSGSYDGGCGEQEDLLAAIGHLEQQGVSDILLAGYSFGAWITSAVLSRRNFLPAVLVAPPISLLPFDFTRLRGRIGLVICGEHDHFCPLPAMRTIADRVSARLVIIDDADHFFSGREAELAAAVSALPSSLLRKKNRIGDK